MTNGRRSFILAAMAVVVAATAGCATGQGGSSASNQNLVTHDELVATNSRTVYDAIGRIRPTWLSSRGSATISNVKEASDAVANVYINGSRMGDVEYLKQVSVDDVEQIRFWNAGEAGARFGMGNPRGVIEIIPRR